MSTTLETVNACLASMGESPLNTLAEPHVYKSAAVTALNRANKSIQSPGWWFNREAATLSPAPGTGFIQLGSDIVKWESGVRSRDLLVCSQAKPWLVQRGSRLYDTRNRTFVIDEEVTGEVVRLVPYEDLPPVMNDYVYAETVLKFQSNYDADNSRRQELLESWKFARVAASSENIRQVSVNMIDNNVRLQRIKSVTRRVRY